MKIILQDSTIAFRPKYASGTETSVTPVFNDYAIGQGYYMLTNGEIKQKSVYNGTYTGVSDLISVDGYSKIKVSNLVNAPYMGLFAFFTSQSQTTGSNPYVYSGENGGSIEVNIPSGSKYIRIGNNTTGNGTRPVGDLVLKLVV